MTDDLKDKRKAFDMLLADIDNKFKNGEIKYVDVLPLVKWLIKHGPRVTKILKGEVDKKEGIDMVDEAISILKMISDKRTNWN